MATTCVGLGPLTLFSSKAGATPISDVEVQEHPLIEDRVREGFTAPNLARTPASRPSSGLA